MSGIIPMISSGINDFIVLQDEKNQVLTSNMWLRMVRTPERCSA